MSLIEKLKLLNFSEEEKKKALEKFVVALSIVNEEDMKSILEYLNGENIIISNAREIKVLTNSKEDLMKKVSILEEIGEVDIYRKDPLLLNKNVIDIYKKIKYCNQIGKEYKNEDGSYKSFLFSEKNWQKETMGEEKVSESAFDLGDSIVTLEPSIDTQIDVEQVELTDQMKLMEPVSEPISMYDEVEEKKDENIVSFNELLKQKEEEEEEIKELESKTTNFSDIRKELEDQLAELNAIKSDSFIGFNEIEPETYGRGMAA